MKKLFTIILLLQTMIPAVFAKDIVPVYPNKSNCSTVGLYQTGRDITVYKEADENSLILYRIRWDEDEFFPQEIGEEKFFVVFLQEKNLALVNVRDITDDWVEIIYNNTTGETGWIKKDDPYKFLTWLNFYNTYGRKYGLKILKGTPAQYKEIKTAPEDEAKTLSTINVAQKIKLNALRGNWALVSVMDMDKTPKTGYIRWRSDDGIRYYFPAVE